MSRNVGLMDRVARGAAASGLLVCAGLAPLPLALRLGAFGVMGAYLALTAVVGRCVGYTLLGRSSCPLDRASPRERP